MKKIILKRALLFLAIVSLSLNAFAQSTVSGTIKDAAGVPVIGASVFVQGTTIGTVSDIDGNYSLTNVPKNAVLECSCIGYSTVTENIGTRSVVNFVLEESAEFLEDVIVTGYMTEKKADLTGSVAVVKMKDVVDIPTGNVLTALQGRVAGMNITSDGTPGGLGTSSRIRGTTTINNSSPLYVIDGVMTRSDLGTVINSNDIESIQVLKDAASAAIYGAQAANGVIVITTKKAKEGSFKIDFNTTLSLQTYRRGIDLLNAQEWGDVYWAAYQYDFGVTPKSSIYGEGPNAVLRLGEPYYEKDGLKMLISDTDWQGEAYRPALMQSYNLSMSKGTKEQTTSASINYIDQDGILKCSDYKSVSTRLNYEYRFLNNKLKVGESMSVTYWTRHNKPNDYESIEKQLLAQHPAQAIYASDGSYAGSEVDLLGSRTNPIRAIDYEGQNIFTSWRVFGNAYVDITPVKNLTLRSSYGVNFNLNNSDVFVPAWDEHVRSNAISSLSVTDQQNLEWVWTNTANYALNKGNHSASFLLGAEFKKTNNTSLTGTGEGFALTSRDYAYLSVAEGTKGSTNSRNLYAMTSYFGKINYNYGERYLLSATVRRDASSRFGKSNNAGIFPSASFGWRISKEGFMSETSNWLSDLKLRAAWGINGNDQINNTATYNIYSVDIWNGCYNLNGDGKSLSSGAVRSQSGNDKLRWEQTEQVNFGIDAAFLNNRLTMTVDYYDKNTTDMLYQLPVPAVNGEGGSSYQNCASMNNKGVEFILGWRNTIGDFSYDINLNGTFSRNKITYLPDDIYYTYGCGNQAAGVTNVGLPYGARIGYVTDGVFRTQAEVDEYMSKYDVQFGAPKVGRIRYTDVNKDGKIDTSDQAYIGSDLPLFEGGLNLSASYKGFDLTMFFSGMVRKAYNTSKTYTDFFPLGEGLGNHSVRLLDAMQGYYDWVNTGTYTSNYAALSTINTNNESLTSDWYVEDGSYLKLKNIVLGYTIPQRVVNKIKVSQARVFLQAQNVFTVTKYSGPDPEALGYPYPFSRSFVLGINFGF